MRQLIKKIALLLSVSASLAMAENPLPAFPGAEGAGALTQGGRGGRVVYVTNLNDEGPGSLRDACTLKGPRIVLFRVSGIIDLKKPIEITSGHLTLAGQSAPGNGICLKGAGLVVKADEVILRYLRIRPGDLLKTEVDGLCVVDAHRVIIDHCSVAWGVDEVLSVVGTSDAVSVQWCIIAEGLHHSVHKKGSHSMGSLLRSHGGTYSFHHCLYAHNNTRNPRPGDNYDKQEGVLLDFRNNVIYDWGGTCGYGVNEKYRMNYVGNYLKAGPSTSPETRKIIFNVGGPGNRVFFRGNILEGMPEADSHNEKIVRFPETMTQPERETVWQNTPFDTPVVFTTTAEQAYKTVLKKVGACVPNRDKIDTRLTKTVKKGRGRIIDSQSEVGGWLPCHSVHPPKDTDADGIPDVWEKKLGLNPDEPADATKPAEESGYTWLETYLNTLVAD